MQLDLGPPNSVLVLKISEPPEASGPVLLNSLSMMEAPRSCTLPYTMKDGRDCNCAATFVFWAPFLELGLLSRSAKVLCDKDRHETGLHNRHQGP